MTYKTKNTTYVIALATLLMAMPFAIGSANAVTGGNGVINPTCGIDEPSSFDLGTVSPGVISTETVFNIVTDASIVGTLEVIATDWVGVGTKSQGSVILTDVQVGDTLTINNQIMTAAASGTVEGTFDVSGTDVQDAAALASQITADTRAVTPTVAVDVTAFAGATSTAVFIRSDTVGTASDAVDLTSSNAARLAIQTGATLGGGTAAGTTHMLAEQVRYAIETDGTGNAGVAYATKVALGVDSANAILTSTTDPDEANDIELYLHLSGVNTAATGTITVLAGLVTGDTITVGDDTFIGDTDFVVTGTEATDATNLAAAINAISVTPQVTATTDGVDVIVTAIKLGFSGDALELTETGGGVTLLPNDNSLDGGDENLIALPYSGALTSSLTFGTACDSG